jgi:hypothetical protein
MVADEIAGSSRTPKRSWINTLFGARLQSVPCSTRLQGRNGHREILSSNSGPQRPTRWALSTWTPRLFRRPTSSPTAHRLDSVPVTPRKRGDRDILSCPLAGVRQASPTKLPQSPVQSSCLCLWLNSNKGHGLEMLIFSNPKIKQSSHCCGARARRRVGAVPIDGRTPSAVFCVESG